MHIAKRSKSKPGSPTEPVSSDATRVQDDASKSHTMEQDINKPFLLVLSVPHNAKLSAASPPMVIEASIFPVNHDNKTMHVTIVDELTNMMCNAMDPYFTVTVKI